MIQRLTLSLFLAALLSGCGGDTSWYVCSGTGDFCGGDRDRDDEDKPLTITALEVSRKTPQLIQEGLVMDGLRATAQQNPQLIAGWLMVSSLGLLVDDSDNASASRFLDDTRYWLMSNDEIDASKPLLDSALQLLASVTDGRDLTIASAATETLKVAALHSVKSVPEAVPEYSAPVDPASALPLAATAMRDVDAEQCCDADVLMAAAVLLCEELTSVDDAAAAACRAAGNWLLSDS